MAFVLEEMLNQTNLPIEKVITQQVCLLNTIFLLCFAELCYPVQ